MRRAPRKPTDRELRDRGRQLSEVAPKIAVLVFPGSNDDRDAAWALVKYLTTNDHALAKFSNGIRNVPSTVSSARSPELIPDKHFRTFIKIFVNTHSQTTPITPIGADHMQTITNFIVKWQAGKVKDLLSALRDVDKQIDAKIKQAGKGTSVP